MHYIITIQESELKNDRKNEGGEKWLFGQNQSLETIVTRKVAGWFETLLISVLRLHLLFTSINFWYVSINTYKRPPQRILVA